MANGQCNSVTLVNHAVSSKTERISISGGGGSAFMKSSQNGAWTLGLPFVLQHEYRSVGFTKIDTEGAEIIVLKSILDAIEQKKVFEEIVMEFTPGWWFRYGVSLEEGLRVVRRFREKGYTVYMVSWCQRARQENAATGIPFRLGSCLATKAPSRDVWESDDMHHVEEIGFGDLLEKKTRFLDSHVNSRPPQYRFAVEYWEPNLTRELWLSRNRGPESYSPHWVASPSIQTSWQKK